MPADLARVEQWMYSTLAADATVASICGTRIYSEQAPQGSAFPMVLFAHIGNIDVVRALGNGRLSKVIYIVRAVGMGSSTQGAIKTVADRFDPLLLVQGPAAQPPRQSVAGHLAGSTVFSWSEHGT